METQGGSHESTLGADEEGLYAPETRIIETLSLEWS